MIGLALHDAVICARRYVAQDEAEALQPQATTCLMPRFLLLKPFDNNRRRLRPSQFARPAFVCLAEPQECGRRNNGFVVLRQFVV